MLKHIYVCDICKEECEESFLAATPYLNLVSGSRDGNSGIHMRVGSAGSYTILKLNEICLDCANTINDKIDKMRN